MNTRCFIKSLILRMTAMMSIFTISLILAAGSIYAEAPNLDPRVRSASTPAALSSVYATSSDASVRLQALRALTKVRKAGTDGEVRELVCKALKEGNMAIAQEAISMAGRLKIAGLDDSLMSLYRNIPQQFEGPDKVKIEWRIISAMGELGGPRARELLSKELEHGIVVRQSDLALEAIGRLKDPLLLPVVTAYAEKVAAVLVDVKETPENSIKYSHYRSTLGLARRVEGVLVEVQKGR